MHSFLGLAGYYRRFVKDFSTIASPLHSLSKKNAPFVWGPSQDTAFNELTKKDVPFVWGTAQEEAFTVLKDKLTHAPLLLEIA